MPGRLVEVLYASSGIAGAALAIEKLVTHCSTPRPRPSKQNEGQQQTSTLLEESHEVRPSRESAPLQAEPPLTPDEIQKLLGMRAQPKVTWKSIAASFPGSSIKALKRICKLELARGAPFVAEKAHKEKRKPPGLEPETGASCKKRRPMPRERLADCPAITIGEVNTETGEITMF
jgi:hypothetical protein